MSRHLKCVFVCLHAFAVCVSAFVWVINERSWMASAGHDSTTARKSFLLSLRTADSELTGMFCWFLRLHHEGAVIITPITASQQKVRGVTNKEEIKAVMSDISFLGYWRIGQGCGLKCSSFTYNHTICTSFISSMCFVKTPYISLQKDWTFALGFKDLSLKLQLHWKTSKCQH